MLSDLNKMLKQMNGDKELLAEIVEIFIADSDHDIAVLQEAIMQKDIQTVVNTAHGLKGELGNLGAETSYQLARNLELAAKERRLDDTAALLQKLIQEIEKLKAVFARPDWQKML